MVLVPVFDVDVAVVVVVVVVDCVVVVAVTDVVVAVVAVADVVVTVVDESVVVVVVVVVVLVVLQSRNVPSSYPCIASFSMVAIRLQCSSDWLDMKVDKVQNKGSSLLPR